MLGKVSSIVRHAVLAAGCTLSGIALAHDAGFYVSGSVGWSEIEVTTTPFSQAGVAAVADETDTAWKFQAGYQFSPHWGVEAGHVDFGDYSITGGGGAAARVDAKAWTLAGVGTLPFGNGLAAFVKLGVFLGQSTGNATLGRPIRVRDHRFDGFGAIGLRYDLTGNFSVQLEAERYNGGHRVQKFQDTNLLTIGVRYRF